MKVIPTSNAYYDTSYRKNNIPTPRAILSSNTAKNDVAFGSAAKTFSVKVFEFIEKNGFFIEFLVVDSLSLVIPRIIIGYNRDKEKTGKPNYKAAAEEAGREMTSGPSMNLIPMGLLALITMAKPASHMERDTLKSLTYNLKQIADESIDYNSFIKGEDLNKALAEKLFDDAFAKFELDDSYTLKDEFVRLLNESKGLKSKGLKNKAKEFEQHVALINNKNSALMPLNTKTIRLHTGAGNAITTLNAKDLYLDFHNYSKDIVEKLTKQGLHTNDYKVQAKTFLDKITKNRLSLKLASGITAFFAVGAFLLYLPKLYQRGDVSPAQESAMRAEGVSA